MNGRKPCTGGEKPACDSLKDSGDWQDALAGFSESTVEDCAKALRMNDLSIVSAGLAASFIDKYKLHEQVKEGSSLHRFLCRELLKAEQAIAGRIKERVNGQYADSYQSALAVNGEYFEPQPNRRAQPFSIHSVESDGFRLSARHPCISQALRASRPWHPRSEAEHAEEVP